MKLQTSNKNYVPGWYVASATISTPEGLIRYIIKPGFSERGEDDASDRKESFLNSLRNTIKLYGYTEDEVKLCVKDQLFFFFSNSSASDTENKILAVLKGSAARKSAKDISFFGISDKGGISKEMFQMRKDFHDEIRSTLSNLTNEDQQKYDVIRSNEKALYNAILNKGTNPGACDEFIDKLASDIDSNKSNDERVAKCFLSDLEEILADQEDDGNISDSDGSVNTKSGFNLFTHFSKDEKPIVSMKNEGRFYFAFNVDNKPYEYTISVRKNGACRLQAWKLGDLSFKNIKKLDETSRLTFKDSDTENSFKNFILDSSFYASKFKPL